MAIRDYTDKILGVFAPKKTTPSSSGSQSPSDKRPADAQPDDEPASKSQQREIQIQHDLGHQELQDLNLLPEDQRAATDETDYIKQSDLMNLQFETDVSFTTGKAEPKEITEDTNGRAQHDSGVGNESYGSPYFKDNNAGATSEEDATDHRDNELMTDVEEITDKPLMQDHVQVEYAFDSSDHNEGCSSSKYRFSTPPEPEKAVIHIEDDTNEPPTHGEVKNEYVFNASDHTKGRAPSSDHLSTPPEPLPSTATIPNDPPTHSRHGTKESGRLRRGPDIDRDLSPTMRAYARLHQRIAHLIPRLPNHATATFDWSRRYWIAVLLDTKAPKPNLSEKDFVWMKGNRFSTVRTVWHAYCNTVQEGEGLELWCGAQKVGMEEEMRGLDWFSDQLVVLRAVRREASEGRVERSLVQGVIQEVVELDDD